MNDLLISSGIVAGLAAPFVPWFEGMGGHEIGLGGWGDVYLVVAIVVAICMFLSTLARGAVRVHLIDDWATYVIGGFVLIVACFARVDVVLNFGGYSPLHPDWGLWLAFGAGILLILAGMGKGARLATRER